MLDEQAIRQEYRVECNPSWRVMKRHGGKWVVVFYCSDEAGAYRILDKAVQNAIRWSSLSDNERMASILRARILYGEDV